MDRRLFASVFAGVGVALGVVVLSLGLVSLLADGSDWGMVMAAGLIFAGVGVGVALVQELAPDPASSEPLPGRGVGDLE